MRGNSIVRHLGETYDELVLEVLSKAYSSLLAFVACPTAVKDLLKVAAAPYLYSGPSPVASLASTLAGFDVNDQKATKLRADLHAMTSRVLGALDDLGAATPNRSGLPIIEVPLANHEEMDAVGRFLFERGIYVTLAAYPLVPKDEVGFRIQVTAANTDEQIESLIHAIGDLASRYALQPRKVDALQIWNVPRDPARWIDRLAGVDGRSRAGRGHLGPVPPGTGIPGKRPTFQHHLGHVVRRDLVGIRLHRPAAPWVWRWFAIGQALFFSATPTHTATHS